MNVAHLAKPKTFAKNRFRVQRELGRGGMGIVYEAVDTERNMQVALKTLHQINADALYYLKKEFRTLHDFVHPNLCSFIDLVEDNGVWLLTMELINGIDFFSYVKLGTDGQIARPSLPTTQKALKSRLDNSVHAEKRKEKPAEILPCRPQYDETKLRLSIAGLCQGLSALHQVGKIHRDIKPSNVLITENDRVVLLDFGLVADLGAIESGEESDIVGTAAYMAPEQAQGDAVGPAADWYSVGVMLYEALTGVLPFSGKPLQMIVDKQTRDPLPPSKRNSSVPADLETLCVGLLQRNPEHRPSVASILEMAQVKKQIPIISATSESTNHYSTHRFVGRTRELGVLYDSWQRMIQNFGFESVVIEGVSGVGKSALIDHFATTIFAKNPSSMILKGRCYERESAPYKAFDGVIESLIRHFNSDPNRDTRHFKPDNAELLVHLFPDLTRLPDFAEISFGQTTITDPHELQNKAFDAFKETLSLLGRGQPLIVIVDDMQWADKDSLSLLQHIVRDFEGSRLLLILLSRVAKNEENLSLVWQRVAAKSYAHIHLRPLESGDAEELARQYISQYNLSHRLDGKSIIEEAEGHPLFITELIQHAALGNEDWKSLRLDEVIRSRINTLPSVAKSLLETISVAGTPISKHHLLNLTAHHPEEFSKSLLILRAHNLIRSRGPRSYDTVEPYHDRVREAVVNYLDEQNELNKSQLKIGRYFLEQYSKGEPSENIFEIVQHVHAFERLITDEVELQRLAELYYLAGKQSRHAAAFASALEFFKKSLALFQNRSWVDKYETLLDLHASAAETAYIVGDFNLTETLVKKAIKEAKSDLDLSKIYVPHVLALQANEQHQLSLDEATKMVQKLGISLPRHPSTFYLLLNTMKTILRLKGYDEADILDLPEATNPRINAAMQLMAIMAHASFFHSPKLWLSLFLVSIKLIIDHGIDKVCSIVFLGWGVMNTAVLKKYAEGYKFGKIALKLMDKFNERFREDMVLFVFATFVQHWKEPLRDTLAYLKQSYQSANKAGSLAYIGHSGANWSYHSFLTGEYLPDVVEQSSKYAASMVHKTQRLPFNTNQIYHQAMLNLIVGSSLEQDSTALIGEAYDETEMLPRHQKEGIKINIWDYYFCSLVLCVLFDRSRKAYEMARATEKYASSALGTYSFAVYPFYAALAYSSSCKDTNFITKLKLLRRFSKHRKYVMKVAKVSKENHSHKHHLLEAEWARHWGKAQRAASFYNLAIEGALENHFLNDAALAAELAGKFYRELNDPEKTHLYFQKAIAYYEKWGATKKVEHMRSYLNHADKKKN